MIEEDFKNVINEIKEDIKNTQFKTMQEVNSNLMLMSIRKCTKIWIYLCTKLYIAKINFSKFAPHLFALFYPLNDMNYHWYL